MIIQEGKNPDKKVKKDLKTGHLKEITKEEKEHPVEKEEEAEKEDSVRKEVLIKIGATADIDTMEKDITVEIGTEEEKINTRTRVSILCLKNLEMKPKLLQKITMTE